MAVVGSESILVEEWKFIAGRASQEARDMLTELGRMSAVELSDVFYDGMFEDPVAKTILNHEDVSKRLRAAMARWFVGIFSSWEPDTVPQIVALQRHLGNVHARIDVKIEVLMRGARLMKRSIAGRLLAAPTPVSIEAVLLAFDLIDLSIEGMSEQYSTAQQVASRTGEAYRNHASSMNMSLERERQRAALADWESQVMQALVIRAGEIDLPRISASSFGLWIRHKAAAMFPNGSEEMGDVLGCLDRIDAVLLPGCLRAAEAGGQGEMRDTLTVLLSEVKRIRFLTDAMFEQLVRLESGRDSLTQLLSRRFQSTILTREIELSRHTTHRFGVLLVDVDHFKQVNDTFGHIAGDRVLQHVANVLAANVRSGDFVFRHGGEEFMAVCVELSDEQAWRIAEKLREAIAAEEIALGPEQRARVTVSVGLAMHDGHPDYQRLIERADRALFDAKRAGRNRCMAAA